MISFTTIYANRVFDCQRYYTTNDSVKRVDDAQFDVW